MGAYTDHVTWSTPGPQFTPLRVTPAEPAAAGAVKVILLLPPEGDDARTVEPAAAVVAVMSAPPGTVLSVPPAAWVWLPPTPEGDSDCSPVDLGLTVGTVTTTSSRATAPTSTGA